MKAYFYHPRRKICRRRKVAWVLERPQFWFENMVLINMQITFGKNISESRDRPSSLSTIWLDRI